jgi:hypothetical protein
MPELPPAVAERPSRNVMRYAVGGFVLGLLTPLLLVKFWGITNVPPIFFFAFWPTVLFLISESVRVNGIVTLFCVLVLNGFIYAAAAAVMRRYSLLGLCGLFLVASFFMPPLESQIASRFPERQPALEELKLMVQSDQIVTSVSSVHLTASGGEQYRFSDDNAPISRERWQRYRTLLKRAGVDEIVKGTQSYFFVLYKLDVPAKLRSWLSKPADVHTFADGLAAYDGYVFCEKKPASTRSPNPSETPEMLGDMVCFAMEPSKRLRSYSYSVLAPNWYSFAIYRRHGPD